MDFEQVKENVRQWGEEVKSGDDFSKQWVQEVVSLDAACAEGPDQISPEEALERCDRLREAFDNRSFAHNRRKS